jgi:acyl-coenzyme A synthetase/AMP-(fatty) acid ligase
MWMVNTVELVERLQIHASGQPDRLAIIDSRRHQSISFAQLNDAVATVAIQLQKVGVQAETPVLVVLPRSIKQWITCIGLLRLGATPHLLEPAIGLNHLENNCTAHLPKALITTWTTHFLKLRSPVLRRIPLQFTVGLPFPGTSLLSVQTGTSTTFRTASSISDGEIALIAQPENLLANLISGTTSLIAESDWLSNQRSSSIWQKSAYPPGLIHGFAKVSDSPQISARFTPTVARSVPRLPARLKAMRLPRIIRQIQQYQPQTITASPDFLEQLVTYGEQHSLKLSNVHRISSDGTPLMPRLLDRLQPIAPHAEIINVYGLSANPIAQIPYQQIQMTEMAAMASGKGLLVGHPNPNMVLKIIPDRSEQATSPLTADTLAAHGLPNPRIGEIVVQEKGDGRSDDSCPKTMPQSALQADGVSWYRTGDAGYLDEQGRLWLMGNCKSQIEDEQGILYPLAVAVSASFHDGVKRTAIVHRQGKRVLLVELKRSVVQNGKAREACLNTLKLVLGWAKIQDYQVVSKIP